MLPKLLSLGLHTHSWRTPKGTDQLSLDDRSSSCTTPTSASKRTPRRMMQSASFTNGIFLDAFLVVFSGKTEKGWLYCESPKNMQPLSVFLTCIDLFTSVYIWIHLYTFLYITTHWYTSLCICIQLYTFEYIGICIRKRSSLRSLRSFKTATMHKV